jgi:hypothetical protein
MSNDTTTKVLPTHRIFSVMKGNDEGKAVWTEIGAAWANKDGKGFKLQFNALPLEGAKIVLRTAEAKIKVAA